MDVAGGRFQGGRSADFPVAVERLDPAADAEVATGRVFRLRAGSLFRLLTAAEVRALVAFGQAALAAHDEAEARRGRRGKAKG